MKKLIKIASILLCLSILLSGNFLSKDSFRHFIYAEETVGEEPYQTLESKILESDRYCSANGSAVTASLNINNKWFLPNEDIVVSYTVSGDEEIQDFDYTATGFEVSDIYISNADSSTINVELDQIESVDEHKLNLNLSLSENDIDVSLFAYKNQYGTFVSQFSIENAFERYLEYAVTENILTPEEAEHEWYEYMSIETDISLNTVGSVNTGTSELGTLSGYLAWEEDDGNIHPLRGVKVEAYCKNGNESVLIGQTITEDSGYFTVNVPANDNVYIKAYAGDENVTVGSGIFGFPYVLDLDEYNHSKNEEDINNETEDYDTYVSIGGGELIDYKSAPITMDTTRGQAFQIAQAAIAGRDYAKDMMNKAIADVTIIYPSLPIIGTCYIPVLSCIAIERYSAISLSSYSAWDVIMHEYGHHIECLLGIMWDPLGEHYSNVNHSDKLGTARGTRLAWGEAWNTVFGLMAQQYLIGEEKISGNIMSVGNSIYDSYGGAGYGLETAERKGEACELSVMAVLWDLYDSNNDGADEITLNHEEYWELTTERGKFRFSDRVNRFYELYADQPEMIQKFAKNLTYYKMAPSMPTITNLSDVSLTVAPILSWDKQGGSVNYPNNSFDIVIYDSSYNEILRIDDIRQDDSTVTSVTYSIDSYAWANALQEIDADCISGIDLFITVSGSRVEPLVVTGPYYSEYKTVSISVPHEFVHTNLGSSSHRCTCLDCGHTLTESHEYEYEVYNSENHKMICSDCGYNKLITHVADPSYIDPTGRFAKCRYCGYLYSTTIITPIIKNNVIIEEEIIE